MPLEAVSELPVLNWKPLPPFDVPDNETPPLVTTALFVCVLRPVSVELLPAMVIAPEPLLAMLVPDGVPNRTPTLDDDVPLIARLPLETAMVFCSNRTP